MPKAKVEPLEPPLGVVFYIKCQKCLCPTPLKHGAVCRGCVREIARRINKSTRRANGDRRAEDGGSKRVYTTYLPEALEILTRRTA